MKHRITEFFRELVMSFAITCLGFVSRIHLDTDTHDYFPEDENCATVVDHLRWQLEGPFESLFSMAFEGSDAELRAVWNSEIPTDCMSARQAEELDRYDPASINVWCIDCDWKGTLAETTGAVHICPQCDDNGVHVDNYPREPLPQASGPLFLLTERRAA